MVVGRVEGEGTEERWRGGREGGTEGVRTRCMTHVIVEKRQLMHRFKVGEHLGVRLPASPPPGPHVQLDGAENAANAEHV